MRAWTIVQIKRVRQLADQGYSIDRLIQETGLTRRTVLTYIRLSENPKLSVEMVLHKKRRHPKPQTHTPITPLTHTSDLGSSDSSSNTMNEAMLKKARSIQTRVGRRAPTT